MYNLDVLVTYKSYANFMHFCPIKPGSEMKRGDKAQLII